MPFRLFLLLLIVVLVPSGAMAADAGTPKKIGAFSGWEAYETKIASHPTCYMTLRPSKQDYKILAPEKAKDTKTKSKDKSKKTESVASKRSPEKRSNVYVMVTFRPSESMNPVVSYRAGYIFKQGSEVLLNTDDKPFNLFTDKDQAWARSGAIDIALTNALRKAKRVIIQGTSNEGGKSTDVFNPDGAEKAYKAIVKACGIT